MSKRIGILVSLLAVAGVAQADDHGWGWHSPPPPPPRHHPVAAPEIDPATAGSALTLLAGGLVVLRGRRGKK